MELHQIRYFLATCETLNFTRAAERCNVSQPALTKSIHMLEAELGGPLFDTQSRPIRLTDLGKLLRDRFRRVEETLTDIKAVSDKYHRLEDSTFTLGVVNTLGEDRFIDIVRRLQERLLGVSITIRHERQSSLIENLKTGRVELAIVTCNNMTGQLDGRALYTEPYVLCAPPDHPLSSRDSIALDELKGAHFVFRSHCEKSASIQDELQNRDIDVQCHLMTDQDDFARLMIRAGLGVSIMPRSLVTPPLVAIRLDDAPIEREIRLAWWKERSVSPIARKMIDVLLGERG